MRTKFALLLALASFLAVTAVGTAFAGGDAIVLLLVKEGATDDELVQQSVERISRPGVSVFVAPASKIARYSRITQGAGVNRVPSRCVMVRLLGSTSG